MTGREREITVGLHGVDGTTISGLCCITGEEHSVEVKREDWQRYMQGDDLIQSVFPYLSAGDREFIKTGISPKGYDILTGKAQWDS